MKQLFEEGGMADDGMDVEPVTGNEIPPGSLAEEVRDDIPAQLSQGEYVVPADVVRFFGVRFFEDLRREAKQGLSQMDADGRIGGTPVDSNGIPMEGDDEALTPEEEAALMEALGATGMAQGGMAMPNFQQPMSNPYENQAMLYQPPQARGNTTGMAEGGLLSQTFTGFESRRYINPETKEERVIQFLDGRPLGSIPAGFVPWTAELAAKPVETPAVETPAGMGAEAAGGGGGEGMQTAGGDGDSDGTFGYTRWAEKNAEEVNKDPLAFGREALQGNKGFMSSRELAGLAGLVNPVLGIGAMGASTFNQVQNIAEARAALEVAKARGLNTADLEAQINLAVEALPGMAQRLVQSEVIGSGQGYRKALEEYRGQPTPAPTVASQQKASTGVGASVTREKSSGNDRDAVVKSGGTTSEKTGGSAGGKQLSKATTTKPSGGNPSAPARATTTSAPRTETYEEKMKRGGGFQKGGLVTKPTKRAKKPNKGLAG